jgi:RNA polymerase sigma factor (sigma-70 family)
VTTQAVAEALRDALAPATAALARALGDLDLADDMVQDAVVAALQRWPADGIPARPELWLLTVARHRAIDRWRREARLQEKLAALERIARAVDDESEEDWLSLLFTCCHPALAREARVGLTLRAVCGLTVTQIASAFLTEEATIAQRIVRAKRKLARAGIAFRVPPPEHLEGRLHEVLTSLYLMFNEGYLSTGGDTAERPDLAASAEWLTSRLAALMPREPEVLGLLALMRLHRARRATRFDAHGALMLLQDQDRHRWDHDAIAAAGDLLVRARACAAPARISCSPPSWPATPRPPPGNRPTGPRSCCSTTNSCAARPLPSPASTAPSRPATSTDPTPRSPRSTPSPSHSTAITFSTPPAPRCCATSTAPTKPAKPTAARSGSPTTPPSGRCSNSASARRPSRAPASAADDLRWWPSKGAVIMEA